jgi:hypothetical protein
MHALVFNILILVVLDWKFKKQLQILFFYKVYLKELEPEPHRIAALAPPK